MVVERLDSVPWRDGLLVLIKKLVREVVLAGARPWEQIPFPRSCDFLDDCLEESVLGSFGLLP